MMTTNSPQPNVFQLQPRPQPPTLSSDGVVVASLRGSLDLAGRYQVTIIASSVENVVESVGGWLFDLLMGGWVVEKLQIDDVLSGRADVRPLRILGYRESRMNVGDLPPMRNRKRMRTVAIGGDVVTTHGRVRKLVQRAWELGTPKIVLWGEGITDPQGEGLTAIQYPLTSAARAYKMEAMRAVRLPVSAVAATETLFCRPTSRFDAGLRWWPSPGAHSTCQDSPRS